MTPEYNAILKAIDEEVERYHTEVLPLPQLMECRRRIAVYSYNISKYVKDAYEKKALSYVIRKHRFAQEVVTAMKQELKPVMSKIESQVEALAITRTSQEEAVKAEALYEGLIARLKSITQLLSAISQEIAVLREEKNTHHQDSGQPVGYFDQR